jgi:hypothetical protein
MAGPGDNLEPDSAKLDCILAHLTTITRRLDTHDQCIARMEKFQRGEDDDPKKLDDDPKQPDDVPPKGPGGGNGHGSGGPFGGSHPDRGGGRDDGFFRRHGGPHEPKLTFPHFDGESDPLPWLNKCEGFFWGYHTLEEDKG